MSDRSCPYICLRAGGTNTSDPFLLAKGNCLLPQLSEPSPCLCLLSAQQRTPWRFKSYCHSFLSLVHVCACSPHTAEDSLEVQVLLPQLSEPSPCLCLLSAQQRTPWRFKSYCHSFLSLVHVCACSPHSRGLPGGSSLTVTAF